MIYAGLIDTNLWVRALISAETRQRLERIIANPAIEIIGNQQLIEEIKDVVARPRLQKFLKNADIESFIQVLLFRFEMVSPFTRIQVCRDPDDDFLLEICHDFKVDYLVTEDEDLLVLHPFEDTQIVRHFDFEANI